MGLPAWFKTFCLPVTPAHEIGSSEQPGLGFDAAAAVDISHTSSGMLDDGSSRRGSSKKKQRKLAKAQQSTARAQVQAYAHAGGGIGNPQRRECCEVTHPFNFSSMVPAVGPVKSPPTTWQHDFVGVVDYIFFTSGSLVLTNRWRMRSAAALTRLGGLPNAQDPSDHQLIAAEFAFTAGAGAGAGNVAGEGDGGVTAPC